MNELMSCSDDITSFMAARSGDGVIWLPLGEGGTGVWVPLLGYPGWTVSSSSSDGARLG